MITGQGKLKPRNLGPDEVKERLVQKYETLVPELDPNRPRVKAVKVLSAKDSLDLAKEQVRKQMESQIGLNSVAGSQEAKRLVLKSFGFCDGYKIPKYTVRLQAEHPKIKFKNELDEEEIVLVKQNQKTVRFAELDDVDKSSIKNQSDYDE